MSTAEPQRPLAVIFGCSGSDLTADERAFFRAADPLGFILFRRNCVTPDQVRRLVDDLRGTVGRADAPVLIDQEGGRVQRLKPPQWPDHPAAGRFMHLAQHDPQKAERAVRLNARSIAHMLSALGITVNAGPVLDLRLPGASDVVGDRAFGGDPSLAARLGRAVADGFLAGGILPIMKHMPGHGRATVDSHKDLPRVDADLRTLEATDFAPFRALADLPWGMTAHVVYDAIDPDRPATLSPRVIGEVIRGRIGFQGVLVSDDLSMGALQGPVGTRAAEALRAGCDLALHCNGVMDEMTGVAAQAQKVTADAARRLAGAARLVGRPAEIEAGIDAAIDAEAMRTEVADLLALVEERA